MNLGGIPKFSIWETKNPAWRKRNLSHLYYITLHSALPKFLKRQWTKLRSVQPGRSQLQWHSTLPQDYCSGNSTADFTNHSNFHAYREEQNAPVVMFTRRHTYAYTAAAPCCSLTTSEFHLNAFPKQNLFIMQNLATVKSWEYFICLASLVQEGTLKVEQNWV
jgi:hypothetical protein